MGLFQDESGNVSSKRIFGAILIIFSMICVFLDVEYIPFLTAGGSLLGIGTLEKFGK